MSKRASIIIVFWGTLLLCTGSAIGAETAERLFYKAEGCYRELVGEKGRKQYRHNWFPCIEGFQKAYAADPYGRFAAAALYMTGKLYKELYGISGLSKDRIRAVDHLTRVTRKFPDSGYSPKAKRDLSSLGTASTPKGNASKKKGRPPKKSVRFAKPPDPDPPDITVRPDLPKKKPARFFRTSKQAYRVSVRSRKPAPPPAPKREAQSWDEEEQARITRLNHWSNPSYTRIVIYADSNTSYTYRLLNADPKSDKPQRLYIDFQNAALGRNVNRNVIIDDNLLLDARAAQYTRRSVRVVVDIKSFKAYKIFSLPNPFRTIVDVWGKDSTAPYVDDKPLVAGNVNDALTTRPAVNMPRPRDLARQFALGVKRIVIDPGHGGHDPGAVGYRKSVYEKNIVLDMGRRLARKIREQLGCEAILTRRGDRFLTLEERTAIANTQNADLFVSLHTNAHPSSRAYGIETYFLNLATDEDAIRVAAFENATTTKSIGDLQTILQDLLQNAKINESSRLARHVQESIVGHLQAKYRRIKNKGVKQAPFYVLMGAQMPAILVETSFISNPQECNRLSDPAYRDALCEGILRGIRRYIKETNPNVFVGNPAKPGES